MSIVDEVDAAPAPNPGLGWLLGVVLVGGQFAYLISTFLFEADRMGAVARAAGAAFWWTDSDVALLIGGLVWSILGLFLVLLACGQRIQLLPDLSRWRWPLVGVAYGVTLALAGLNASQGLRGGYAGESHVTWMASGRAPATRRWEEAQGLQASCVMTGRRRDTPGFDYEVFFAGGRSARLSYGHFPTTDAEELWAWVGRLEQVNRRLRALPQANTAAFDRGHEVEADCLRRYTDRLSAEDAARFRRVLAVD